MKRVEPYQVVTRSCMCCAKRGREEAGGSPCGRWPKKEKRPRFADTWSTSRADKRRYFNAAVIVRGFGPYARWGIVLCRANKNPKNTCLSYRTRTFHRVSRAPRPRARRSTPAASCTCPLFGWTGTPVQATPPRHENQIRCAGRHQHAGILYLGERIKFSGGRAA
eukprot:8450882-Pyramimonas_sp.AAC.2